MRLSAGRFSRPRYRAAPPDSPHSHPLLSSSPSSHPLASPPHHRHLPSSPSLPHLSPPPSSSSPLTSSQLPIPLSSPPPPSSPPPSSPPPSPPLTSSAPSHQHTLSPPHLTLRHSHLSPSQPTSLLSPTHLPTSPGAPI